MSGILPCQSIGTCARKAYDYTSKQVVSKTKRYGFLTILLILIGAIKIESELGVNYKDYWYPFITNAITTILLLFIFYYRRQIKLCPRVVFGLKCLIALYLYNSFVMITEIYNKLYYTIVTYLLIGCAFIAFIWSLLLIYKKNK